MNSEPPISLPPEAYAISISAEKLLGVFDSENARNKMELEININASKVEGRANINGNFYSIEGSFKPEGIIDLSLSPESPEGTFLLLNGKVTQKKQLIGTFEDLGFGKQGKFEITLSESVFRGNILERNGRGSCEKRSSSRKQSSMLK